MNLTLFTILFTLGVITFFASWVLTRNKEFQILVATVSWILMVVSALSAFNITTTVYDGDWITTSYTDYTFVIVSFLIVVIQSLHVFVLLMEYTKDKSRRNK